MGITAVKEAIEDWVQFSSLFLTSQRRYQSDNEVNRKAKAQVLSTGNFVDIPWEIVRNGDILLLKTDEEVPADLVLLTSRFPAVFK